MTKNIVHTTHAPAAVGPYSQAVVANGFVFTAGQIGLVPVTGKMIEGGITEQTTQVFSNLKAVLEAAGSSIDHAVKATVFLSDMANFGAMNAVYSQMITSNPPARSTIQVARLPMDALVEIEMVALV